MHRFKYFSSKINREVQEVYWYTAVHSLALAMVMIFEPIYLYSLGFSISKILWFYVFVYAWYALLVSLGAKFAGRFGYKHAIFISNIFYVLYWLTLFGIGKYDYLFYVAPLLFALQKSWFWPAYDADMALNSKGAQQGREVGALFSLIQVVFIVGPFIGGYISFQFGFVYLFAASALLMLFSAYPLFKSAEIYSVHEFKFKNLLQVWRNHKSNFWGYWGFAEDLMIMSLWPIFMFIAIPNTFHLGVVSAIATVIGTVLMLYVGRLVDRQGKRSLIFGSAVFYGATWILRFVARDVFSVLTFDALTKTSKDIMTVPVMALTYEKTAEKKADYAIAYSVFFEFSLSIAKIFTALAGIVIFYFVTDLFVAMALVFALAGVLTLFYGFLK